MKLSQVRFNWDALASEDPLSAVSTERAPGAWDDAAFCAAGRAVLAGIRTRAEELGLTFRGARALDFGCGVGRLSAPLAESFAAVDAVDVSRVMLRAARARIARIATIDRIGGIRFLHNVRADLTLVPDGAYDLVFSHLTLQHMPPDLGRRYLAELARKVAPGGALYVQVPERSHASAERLIAARGLKAHLRACVPGTWLERYRFWRNGRGRMDMFGLAPDDVRAWLEAAGLELLAADPADDTAGLLPSRRYFARARTQ